MEKTPKVFISYSWTTPQHEEKVVQLANRLMSHGVEVILDKWDLKEGQDKYSFMEQSVTDINVDRVLLICDKVYTEKANERKGGVGDETIIITPEIYGKANQEKFIPVIFEYDDDGNAYMPTYSKSRIYIDLSSENNYEDQYEKLLRNIHNKPLIRKPQLGKIPEWIESENIDVSELKDMLKQYSHAASTNENKAKYLLKRFEDLFIEKLHTYKIGEVSGQAVVSIIDEMKIIRDIYLDFVDVLMLHEAE